MATQKKYVSLEKLGLYDDKIKKVISDGDAAALASAKSYADGLATNYDASGSATTAESNAKAYTDAREVEINKGVVAAQNTADSAVAAAGVADGKAVAAQNDVDALETYVGTIPESATAETVVGYIDEKTANIASDATVSALGDRVTQAETDIDNIEKDYLKAADKTELEGKITTAQTAADGAKTYAEGVAADLASAIETLEGADEGQVARIAILEGQIQNLSGAMHFEGVKDTIPEDVSSFENGDVIIVGNKEYVFSAGAFVEFGDVSAEGERLTALETHQSTYEAKVGTLETKMTAVEGVAAAAAPQTALDSAVEALEDADSTLSGRIDALEGKFGEGEGSVADMIADAQAAAEAHADSVAASEADTALADAKKYADDEDAKIEATVATLTETVGTKAAQSDLEALAARVTTAEGEIDTLQSEMDTVEALATANDAAHKANAAAIALKAAQSDLDAAVVRIEAVETWQNNMIEVSEQEINDLFA